MSYSFIEYNSMNVQLYNKENAGKCHGKGGNEYTALARKRKFKDVLKTIKAMYIRKFKK